MPPRIRMPRARTYTPLSRRHKRNLWLVLCAVAVFGAFYIYNQPVDRLAVSFEAHEAYMNDRLHVPGFVAQDSYDWRKAPFHNTILSYKSLPTGKPLELPRVQHAFPPESQSRKELREQRRVAVRKEFARSWHSYRRFAWAKDELMPNTGKATSAFGGWGATIVDSLDTLWIMGFKDDFYEAVGAVAHIDFGKTEVNSISVFETTIRYLGGLLSAYDLSHEKVLLDKAIQMGELLYRAFDTKNNTPLDRFVVETAKQEDGTGFSAEYSICLAGFGSLTMEFTRLAQITGNPKFYDVVARVTEILDREQSTTKIPGLFPIWVNAREGGNMTMDSSFTIGAMADSTYEYFPKVFALLGGLDRTYKKLYEDSAAMIDKYLLFRPMIPDDQPGDELLYCGDLHLSSNTPPKVEPDMQHLTCFIGGFFALAGRLFQNQYHVDLGAKLTEGCIYAYKTMPTGIMPETFKALACPSRTSCPWNATFYEEKVLQTQFGKSHADFEAAVQEQNLPPGFTEIRDKRYLLRPEAIESVFVMYRITGHEEYMEHAWDMFTSIRKYTRTRFANGQVFDVTDDSTPISTPEDKMESFWLAETLKYFYLIFSPPDMISLDDWVLNTEAHPFRRPKEIKKVSGG